MSIKTKIKYKYIRQLHERGCSLACMAMITGLSYDFIDKQFENNFDKKGIRSNVAMQFICEQGFDCIEKTSRIYTKIGLQNKRILVPFADIHYVAAQQFADAKTNHAFIMLKNGKIWDPDDPKHTTVFDRFYEILVVLGFWRS